jgi:hypothetical protein
MKIQPMQSIAPIIRLCMSGQLIGQIALPLRSPPFIVQYNLAPESFVNSMLSPIRAPESLRRFQRASPAFYW